MTLSACSSSITILLSEMIKNILFAVCELKREDRYYKQLQTLGNIYYIG